MVYRCDAMPVVPRKPWSLSYGGTVRNIAEHVKQSGIHFLPHQNGLESDLRLHIVSPKSIPATHAQIPQQRSAEARAAKAVNEPKVWPNEKMVALTVCGRRLTPTLVLAGRSRRPAYEPSRSPWPPWACPAAARMMGVGNGRLEWLCAGEKLRRFR